MHFFTGLISSQPQFNDRAAELLPVIPGIFETIRESTEKNAVYFIDSDLYDRDETVERRAPSFSPGSTY